MTLPLTNDGDVLNSSWFNEVRDRTQENVGDLQPRELIPKGRMPYRDIRAYGADPDATAAVNTQAWTDALADVTADGGGIVLIPKLASGKVFKMNTPVWGTPLRNMRTTLLEGHIEMQETLLINRGLLALIGGLSSDGTNIPFQRLGGTDIKFVAGVSPVIKLDNQEAGFPVNPVWLQRLFINNHPGTGIHLTGPDASLLPSQITIKDCVVQADANATGSPLRIDGGTNLYVYGGTYNGPTANAHPSIDLRSRGGSGGTRFFEIKGPILNHRGIALGSLDNVADDHAGPGTIEDIQYENGREHFITLDATFALCGNIVVKNCAQADNINADGAKMFKTIGSGGITSIWVIGGNSWDQFVDGTKITGLVIMSTQNTFGLPGQADSFTLFDNGGMTQTENLLNANSNQVLVAPMRTDVLAMDATAGNRTVELPNPTGVRNRRIVIKKIDVTANTVTITATGGGTFDGAASIVLTAQWQAVEVMARDSDYIIVGEVA